MKWTLSLIGKPKIVGECESYNDAMKQANEHCNVGFWSLLDRYTDEEVDYTEYMGFLYGVTKEKRPYPNECLGSLVIDNDGGDSMTLLDYELPTNQDPNPFIIELPRGAEPLCVYVKEYQATHTDESGVSFGPYASQQAYATFLINPDNKVCSCQMWCYEPNDTVDIKCNTRFIGVANVGGSVYHYWIGV